MQRALDQLAVVKLPVLHNLHQRRARLFVNDVGRVEPSHEFGELLFTQGQWGGGHDDMLRDAVPTVACDLQRRFHADNRDGELFPQRIDRGGCRRIAGDDHGFDAFANEVVDNGECEFPHLFGSFRAVRGVRGIAEIQDLLIWQVFRDFTHNRDAAQPGIEHADRCSGSHGSSSTIHSTTMPRVCNPNCTRYRR